MTQRRIGLTGGIATGKSTVARYLEVAHHLPVMDADIYAREAVQPGSPILEAIGKHFGPAVLNADGTLNRRALGEVVFHDAAARQWLEHQIHPYVRQGFQRDCDPSAPIAVLVVPLLFEAGFTDQVSEIWVVTCAEVIQRQRLQQRDQLSEAAVSARLASQWPLAQKVAQADVVLTNEGDLADLFRAVDCALGRPAVATTDGGFEGAV
ncbi:MAG: dephospho-CoA kinase [Gloeomargaritaceae cyanobacterium C42_A2020_066]|nr:dephospho-CoA kinase [Gloeomargaritaceae cyanobacterium C42_A2020_066]